MSKFFTSADFGLGSPIFIISC